MADNVDNLVLEQLRQMREEMKSGFAKVQESLGDLETKVDGHTGVLVALGKYIHDIDSRVEHIERKLGIED